MIFLLDTHLLLWVAGRPDRLSDSARRLIKTGRGGPDFSADPRLFRRGLLENGYTELAISSEHAAAVVDLPAHHADPFDRILVAQARVEGLVLLTTDPALARSGSPVDGLTR